MREKGTFLGRTMSQTWGAISLWEKVLTRNDFSRIIEIGTMKGVLSHYFLLFCKQRGAEFHTFDIKDFGMPEEVRWHFHQADVFEPWNITIIKDLIHKEGQTILFCDGGDKPKELETFAPFLKKGDLIATHDWGTEVYVRDVPEGVERTFDKECKKEGMTQFFIKL